MMLRRERRRGPQRCGRRDSRVAHIGKDLLKPHDEYGQPIEQQDAVSTACDDHGLPRWNHVGTDRGER